jgi:peptide/nickel transport system permease protein
MIASAWVRWRMGLGAALLVTFAGVAILAPVIAPNDPNSQFPDKAYAPPMRVRIVDGGGIRAPFVRQQVLEDRLARRYRDSDTAPLTLIWFSDGRLVTLDPSEGPLLLLGADSLGRDLLSRLVHGARLSFALAALGVAGALVLGALIGGLAGSAGGRVETGLMFITDFFLVLPGAYLVLVLRGALPLILSTAQVFFLMAVLFAVAAWPHAARGVRAIVATERQREYAMAARAAGAGPLRLMRHLLPAARSFLGVEVMLLIPALLVAEATVSYLGLGFPVPTPSLGTMLQDAAKVSLMREAPWLLAPAATLFVVVLAVQLIVWTSAPATDLLVGSRRTLSRVDSPRAGG